MIQSSFKRKRITLSTTWLSQAPSLLFWVFFFAILMTTVGISLPNIFSIMTIYQLEVCTGLINVYKLNICSLRNCYMHGFYSCGGISSDEIILLWIRLHHKISLDCSTALHGLYWFQQLDNHCLVGFTSPILLCFYSNFFQLTYSCSYWFSIMCLMLVFDENSHPWCIGAEFPSLRRTLGSQNDVYNQFPRGL